MVPFTVPAPSTLEPVLQLVLTSIGQFLADEIQRYGEEGRLCGEPHPAAPIGQAIKFVNNGIEALRTPNNGLGDLSDGLPDLNDELA